MTRRILITIAVLLALLCGFALAEGATVIASGDCGDNGSNVTWTLDSEGTLTISGKGEMEDYWGINTPWSSNCESIKTVAIEAGVTSIGGGAFYRCSSLSSVTIPAGVTRIDYGAFRLCGNLSSITIPEGVTSIDGAAFYGCTGLTSIVIPKSVEIIDENAFSNCESLTSIVIPEGVKNIDRFAFYSCLSLRSVTLPASLLHIGQYVFEECAENLTITAPTGSYASEWIEESGLLGDLDELTRNGIVYSLLSNWAIVVDYDHDNEPTTAVIPSQINGLPVTKIADGAFSECYSLTSIVIPESVTSIGDHAFAWCDDLRSIVMPKRLTYLGKVAFDSCLALTSITIPEGVTSIGNDTFFGCKSLTSVTLPASVTSIADNVFELCSSDLVIFAPEGSHAVGWANEHGYIVATTHVVVVTPAVPATHVTTGLTEGTHCAVCGEVLLAQEIIPVVELAKLVLPADLLIIEEEAFAGDGIACAVLPDGCTEIGAAAFKDCAQLRFVEIPASVSTIDSSAFDGCDDLIIVTVSGSEAERFAKEMEITCVLKD